MYLKAFALSGRIANIFIIPRALPWARGFCPFRACSSKIALSLPFRACSCELALSLPFWVNYFISPLLFATRRFLSHSGSCRICSSFTTSSIRRPLLVSSTMRW